MNNKKLTLYVALLIAGQQLFGSYPNNKSLTQQMNDIQNGLGYSNQPAFNAAYNNAGYLRESINQPMQNNVRFSDGNQLPTRSIPPYSSVNDDYLDYQERLEQQNQPAINITYNNVGYQRDGITKNQPRNVKSYDNDDLPTRVTPSATQAIQELTAKDAAEKDAEDLIQRCYFSAEMQYAVKAVINNKLFQLNVITGKVDGIPSIQEIIDADNGTNNASLRLNALHAALEATRLAKFVAGLEVAYDNPEYILFAPTLSTNILMPPLDQYLIQALKTREAAIIAALKSTSGYNSLWSWIPTNLVNLFRIAPKNNRTQTAEQQDLTFRPNYRNLHAFDNRVTLSDATMKDIIKYYDYKQKANLKEAANLLFKQCFIAQQNFIGNDWPLYTTPAGSSISATNYIGERFLIDDKHVQTFEQIIQHIKSAVQSKNHTAIQAHALLLQLRKAMQTAMFIANKNSSFNMGYNLPSIITKSLDDIVYHLYDYDRQLDVLCKETKLGATLNDSARSNTWNNIATIAAGVGIVAAGTAIALQTETGQAVYNKGAAGVQDIGKNAYDQGLAWIPTFGAQKPDAKKLDVPAPSTPVASTSSTTPATTSVISGPIPQPIASSAAPKIIATSAINDTNELFFSYLRDSVNTEKNSAPTTA